MLFFATADDLMKERRYVVEAALGGAYFLQEEQYLYNYRFFS
jgi:hypothetical protein